MQMTIEVPISEVATVNTMTTGDMIPVTIMSGLIPVTKNIKFEDLITALEDGGISGGGGGGGSYDDTDTRACDLTGLNTALTGSVTASDNIVQAFGRLEHRVNLNDAKVGYTTGLFNSDLATKTTSNLTEGSGLYYTSGRFDAAFAAKSTTNLTEGSGLYFTNARADGRITAARGAVNGIAPLGSDSKIPSAYLPSIAITDTFVVSSEAAMLALTAERGDIVVRTDISKTFILQSDSPTTLVDWVWMMTPDSSGAVTSFNMRTGNITLIGTDVTDALTYSPVNRVGDTLTGALQFDMDSTSPVAALILNNTGSGQQTPGISFRVDGTEYGNLSGLVDYNGLYGVRVGGDLLTNSVTIFDNFLRFTNSDFSGYSDFTYNDASGAIIWDGPGGIQVGSDTDTASILSASALKLNGTIGYGFLANESGVALFRNEDDAHSIEFGVGKLKLCHGGVLVEEYIIQGETLPIGADTSVGVAGYNTKIRAGDSNPALIAIGNLTGFTIVDPGLEYAIGDCLSVPGGNGDAIITVTSVGPEGQFLAGDITTAGSGYQIGDDSGAPWQLGNITVTNEDAEGATITINAIEDTGAGDANGGTLFLDGGLASRSGLSSVVIRTCAGGAGSTEYAALNEMLRCEGNQLSFFGVAAAVRQAIDVANTTLDFASAITQIQNILIAYGLAIDAR